jgi:hypothetical protein
MATPYEKEVVELLTLTKAKAIALLIIDGNKGSNFEIRTVNEKYMRQLPQALIQIASKIEADLNAKEGELKKRDAKEKLEIVEFKDRIDVEIKRK